MRISRIFAVGLVMAMALGAALAAPPNGIEDFRNVADMAAGQILDRAIEREQVVIKVVRQTHPIVETYLQSVRFDKELGSAPVSDRYFIGRLEMSKGFNEGFYSDIDKSGWTKRLIRDVDITKFLRRFFATDFLPVGFTAMIFPDVRGLDRTHYSYQFMGREFLGDVRCLRFEVMPKEQKEGRFMGHIWVEDKDYNIVRFNGAFVHPPQASLYFHMDSWRTEIRPGLWLPSEIYSEELGTQVGTMRHMVRFKAKTRLWDYESQLRRRGQELTQMIVEPKEDEVKDESEVNNDRSPLASLRAWRRDSEDNALDRLERSGLLAVRGPVDEVLRTVVNNLEITNSLDLQPEVRCRVLLTTPLESFVVNRTIVVSRGLLDVLPDEASLAMVLAHELAHILRNDQTPDVRYAYSDRVMFADTSTFLNMRFERAPKDEQEADKRALELLKKSPYSDKLTSAGLFLRQLAQRASSIPNLTKARLGNGLTDGAKVVRMTDLLNSAPELKMRTLDQVAALPLGSHIKLNPWGNSIVLMKPKALQVQSVQEKMPFEVAPVSPYLTRIDVQEKFVAEGAWQIRKVAPVSKGSDASK